MNPTIAFIFGLPLGRMKQPCRLLGTDVELTPKCRVEQDAVSAIGIQGDVNICNILRNTTDRIF